MTKLFYKPKDLNSILKWTPHTEIYFYLWTENLNELENVWFEYVCMFWRIKVLVLKSSIHKKTNFCVGITLRVKYGAASIKM